MTKPFIFAPAMNTDMWDHPITAKQLQVLNELGYKMIPPVEKKLACGVIGTKLVLVDIYDLFQRSVSFLI